MMIILEKGFQQTKKFALDVYEMDAEDWILTFGLDIINPVAVLIERTITRLKERRSFDIDDIIKEIEKDEKTDREIKNAGAGLFEAANTWGIFSKKRGLSNKDNSSCKRGCNDCSDLSIYNSVGSFNVRALVISLVYKKIVQSKNGFKKKEEVESVSKGLDFFLLL